MTLGASNPRIHIPGKEQMNLVDTHAHLDTPRFGARSEQRLAALHAAEAGISAILIPGIEPASWDELLACAKELRTFEPRVCFHTALGIHPQALPSMDPTCDERAIGALRAVVGTAPQGMVAIGECGLDFGALGAGASRERQVLILRAHCELARRTGLPLILHAIRAHAVLLEVLQQEAVPPSILHSYSGSAEMVPAFCRLGHAISLAGSITLPGARRPVLAAQTIPLDRLLLESDSPDQTPYSRRPARNEPAFVVEVARAVAEARRMPLSELAAATSANARRLFGAPA